MLGRIRHKISKKPSMLKRNRDEAWEYAERRGPYFTMKALLVVGFMGLAIMAIMFR